MDSASAGPVDRRQPSPQADEHRLDIDFTVPYRHRLRFTHDLFTTEQDVLWELLEQSGPAPARVQIWLDDQVDAAMPELAARCERLFRNRPDQVTLTDPVLVLPGGEACKNDPGVVDDVLDAMHRSGLDRRSYVIVIGGGAVLDAVGYAAAIAHRGIRLIRLPTTTLAQCDSGVGVKNAVNGFGKKNWLGTFAVPWAVVNDVSLLATLPDRDFRCGFSEAVKVTLLKRPDVFDRICRTATAIRDRDLEHAVPILAESAKLHLRHITEGGDPFEMLEARPLDFGHWSAHKLEPMTRFEVRHGEAVAIGVALDVVYSSLRHGLPASDADRVLRCLRELGLPTWHPLLHERTDELLGGLEEFRQHLGGRLTVTLLRGIGHPLDVHEVDIELMRTAIDRLAERRPGRANGTNGANGSRRSSTPLVTTH